MCTKALQMCVVMHLDFPVSVWWHSSVFKGNIGNNLELFYQVMLKMKIWYTMTRDRFKYKR